MNGREITYVDGQPYPQGNTAAALAEAQRLVQQEGVAAIVPAITSVPPDAVPGAAEGAGLLVEHHPARVGHARGTSASPVPWWRRSRRARPVPPRCPSMLSQQFKDEGDAAGGKGKTIAIIGSDDESAKSGVEQAKKTFQVEGYKVTYAKGAFSITTPTSDYTPFVQAIMTSNGGDPPDIAYLVASFNDVQGLAKGLRQAGFEGIIVNPTTYDPRIVKAAETLEVYTQWATPEAAPDNPNIQKVVDSIAKQDPERGAQPGHARRRTSRPTCSSRR